MTQNLSKLDFTLNPNFKPSTFQLSTPPVLLNQPQSTNLSPVNPNVSAIVTSHFPASQGITSETQNFQRSEIEALQECDALGKKITTLQYFIRDLDNLDIDQSHYAHSLKQQIGMPLYREICALIALQIKGNADVNEGEQLLNQNFRIILRFKDSNGRNLLEQIVALYQEKLELERCASALNSIAVHLSQANQTQNLFQKGVYQAKAIEGFEKLPILIKGAICEKIWRLDNSPMGNANYGWEQIQRDAQKILYHRDASPLKDYLVTVQNEIQKPISFTCNYTNEPAILPTDSKKTLRNLLDLYQLEDLKKLCNDPGKTNEILLSKFRKIHPDLRNLIYKLVWISCNKPSINEFGERLIANNVRILSQMLKNDEGIDILSLLINHQKELIKGQRQIDELLQFSLSSVSKNSSQILSLFNALSESSKENLRRQVWLEDGGKNDPNFGGWGYATRKIEQNPLCLFYGTHQINPFRLHFTDLEQRVLNANKVMLEDFDRLCTPPETPIDISSNRLFQKPNLIQKLPPQLKTAFVTAEFSGVASLGGLGSALDGMVRGFGSDSRVIMPLYLNGPISENLLNTKREKVNYELELNGKKYKVFKAYVNGVRVYLIDAPELFWIPKKEDGTAGNFYNGDWAHVKRRWAVFQNLAAQLTYKMSQKTHPVELVHVHDSQTALVPELLAAQHPEEWKQGKTPATVFTFHNNLETNNYEDSTTMDILQEIGLAKQPLNSFIKGLEVSDVVTTVSDTFGKEAQTPTFGNGVHAHVKIAAFREKAYSVVNGNSNGFDPSQDEQLKNWKSVFTNNTIDLRFGPNSLNLGEKIVTIQKELCSFLRTKNFEDPAYADLDPEKPIVFYVGRYDSSQKGIDKLPLIMEEALKNGAQFVCVGVEPDPRAKTILEKMQQRAKELGKKGVLILEDRKVNGKFVHQGVFGSLLRAAAMIPIAPSLYEPCGLVQGEHNRFTKRVLATATGGFNDTLKTEGPEANGYLFKRCNNWYSQEQDDEIKKTLAVAINDTKKTMHALYHENADAQRPYLDQMRAISRNALNSTWEKTSDRSPHAIMRLEMVYAEAFDKRSKRAIIPANIKTFKV